VSNENHITVESEDGSVYVTVGLSTGHFTVEEAETLISDLKKEVKALKRRPLEGHKVIHDGSYDGTPDTV
jgi:hypothetical protein